MKTNAARLLDSLGIAYEIREYEVDENDLSAESVATKVGLPQEQVFKTLVARGDRNGVGWLQPAVAPRPAKAGRYTGNVRPRVSSASGSINMPTTNAIAVNATGLPMV